MVERSTLLEWKGPFRYSGKVVKSHCYEANGEVDVRTFPVLLFLGDLCDLLVPWAIENNLGYSLCLSFVEVIGISNYSRSVVY